MQSCHDRRKFIIKSGNRTRNHLRDQWYVIGATKKEIERLYASSVVETGSGYSTKICLENAIVAGLGYATKQQQSTDKGKLSLNACVDRKTMRCNHCGKVYQKKVECFHLIKLNDRWRSQWRKGLGVGNLVSTANKLDGAGNDTEGAGAAAAVTRVFEEWKETGGVAAEENEGVSERGIRLGRVKLPSYPWNPKYQYLISHVYIFMFLVLNLMKIGKDTVFSKINRLVS